MPWYINMHNILIMHYNNDKNKNALYDIQWRPCCYYAPSSNREFIIVEQDPSDWLTEHLERGILPDKATIFLTEHLFGNARESGKPGDTEQAEKRVASSVLRSLTQAMQGMIVSRVKMYDALRRFMEKGLMRSKQTAIKEQQYTRARKPSRKRQEIFLKQAAGGDKGGKSHKARRLWNCQQAARNGRESCS